MYIVEKKWNEGAMTCLVALYEKIMISPRKSWYEVIQFRVKILTLNLDAASSKCFSTTKG